MARSLAERAQVAKRFVNFCCVRVLPGAGPAGCTAGHFAERAQVTKHLSTFVAASPGRRTWHFCAQMPASGYSGTPVAVPQRDGARSTVLATIGRRLISTWSRTPTATARACRDQYERFRSRQTHHSSTDWSHTSGGRRDGRTGVVDRHDEIARRSRVRVRSAARRGGWSGAVHRKQLADDRIRTATHSCAVTRAELACRLVRVVIGAGLPAP